LKNIAASVRDRLMNQARASGVPFAALMERFVIGRLLWRVSKSGADRQFVLKGAQLFSLWANAPHRPTRDLDLLGFGDSSVEGLKIFFSNLLDTPPDPDDGLIWGKVEGSLIREDQRYEGVRISTKANLAGAIVPAQVDVGFGDIVTPVPVEMSWKELLGFPEARLLAYPPETVIAEKLNAAEELGVANSRMKDFYDLAWLSDSLEFDLSLLRSAIQATFDRRGTPFPQTMPVAFTPEFYDDPSKVKQWSAFLRKNRLEARSLADVALRLNSFFILSCFPRQIRLLQHGNPARDGCSSSHQYRVDR
jgi:hypothetical protein